MLGIMPPLELVTRAREDMMVDDFGSSAMALWHCGAMRVERCEGVCLYPAKKWNAQVFRSYKSSESKKCCTPFILPVSLFT